MRRSLATIKKSSRHERRGGLIAASGPYPRPMDELGLATNHLKGTSNNCFAHELGSLNSMGCVHETVEMVNF
jgi:hypothetical protein